MCQIEKKLKSQSFFVLDENFLLHRSRALRLLELMEQHNKSWSLHIFSSARVLKSYAIEQLIGLGISWVWMGLEGKNSQYTKLNGIDTKLLVKELQSHGIRVLGSSIIGLENHTPKNIDEAIDWAVSHDSDFHQFMLYTPVPGTALYEKHLEEGNILSEEERPAADTHGQYRFNFHHKHIPNGQETEFLTRAFKRDFEINGPSIARIARTTLLGWKKYKNHSNSRIRKRFEREVKGLTNIYAGVIWAMKKWYKKDKILSGKIASILRDLYEEFGWKARTIAPLLGRVVYFTTKREVKRLANGWTYEPSTRYNKNTKALELEKVGQKALDELSKFKDVYNEVGDQVLEKAIDIEGK
tara:strand:- start:183 stop:1247 length:1065 start_codon:yes stop_codon:yes gene_type:complete